MRNRPLHCIGEKTRTCYYEYYQKFYNINEMDG